MSTEDQRERGAGARRWRRPLLVALGVMVGLAVTIRVAAPFAAAWWIESAVHRETGLPAHVEDVDLWLLRGAIAIEGAVVAARRGEMPERGLDPATALVSGRRLYVDLEWMDLLEGRIRLRELAVDGLRVRLETAPEGGVDLAFLSGISERAPEPEPGKSPQTSSEAWPFRLDALVLRDARFEVVDPTIDPEPAALALAEISIEDLSFEGGAFSLGAVAIRERAVRLGRDFVLRTARGGVSEPTSTSRTFWMIGSSLEVAMMRGSPPVSRTLLISGCVRMYSKPSLTSLVTSSFSSMSRRLRKQNRQYAAHTSLTSNSAVESYLCSTPLATV